MNPEHERFAGLATRPLEGTPDLREEARAEVLGRLAHGGGGDLADATARLTSSGPRSHWTPVCVATAALVVLVLWAAWLVKETLSEVRALQNLVSFGSNPDFEGRLQEQLDQEARDFVFAGVGNDREAIKTLQRQWELHPDEPGIYEELIHRRLAVEEGLPTGFSETWRRFDADNGMWLYLEAVGKRQEWKLSGAFAYTPFSREALDLLVQSAAAPRFESYLPSLRNRRLAMLGETDTLAKETELLLYSISALWEPSVRRQRDAVLLFGKAATEAAAKNDAVELASLIRSWECLVGRLGRNGTTLLGLIVPASSWNDDGKAMLQACRDLHLTEEAARLDELQKEFADYRAAMGRPVSDTRPLSSLARVMAIGPVPDVTLDASAFEPGRRVEYAVVERMLGLAAAIVALLFFTGATIESIRRGRRVNGLAAGLSPLFQPADILWIAGLGIVLPALWYFGITRWTPFGLRDIGMSEYAPSPMLIQAGAALVFALLVGVQAARWRVAARAGFLALKPARPWIGWTMAGIAAAVIPLAGGVRWLSGNEVRYLQAVAATGGLSLLWLLWEAASVVFSSRDHALGGVLLCRRMLVPFAMLAALLLACWAPLLATERHWHALDEVTRADREHSGLTKLESRVVERVRERVRKAFPDTAGIR
jgi:hypothetical protein